MVQLTINGIKVNAEEGMTILDAAKSVGISIPTLCHLKILIQPALAEFVRLKLKVFED